MLTSVLEELGLSDKERSVYLLLIRQPAVKPSEVAAKLKLPRTTTQHILRRLHSLGFVRENLTGATIQYEAEHPDNLLAYVEQRKNRTLAKFEKSAEDIRTILPQLFAMMDSARSLPQVKFFRGLEGAREVLFDTLTSKTELLDFANIDAMFDVVKEVNDSYVAAREKSKITKRSLLLDTAFARSVYEGGAYSPKSHKGYKWIPQELYPFTIEMNIYSGKVSYLTYVREEIIGVIIENDYIHQMHSSMWKLIWDLLPPVSRTKAASPRKTMSPTARK